MPNIIHSHCIRVFILLTYFQVFSLSVFAQKAEPYPGFKYKKGYYHLLNEKGKVNKDIEPFTYAELFSEDLALVEKDLKFGFIDKKGKQVIPFKFTDAGSFKDGITYAAVNGKYGYINKQGKFIIEPEYEYSYPAEDGTFKVKRKNTENTANQKDKYLFQRINKEGIPIVDTMLSNTSTGFNVLPPDKDGNFQGGFKKDGHVFFIVEEMPQFPGGQEGLIDFIRSSVRYPVSAQRNQLEGKVYVRFIIDRDGSVVDVNYVEELPPVKIGDEIKSGPTIHINELPPILVKEAIRSVKSMPKWKPGKQRGKTVRVSYILPINFALN